MDEYEDAALSIGRGIRNLRDLIEAERERQDTAHDTRQASEPRDKRRSSSAQR